MKLYCGSLSEDVTADDLRAAFSEYGGVDSADIATDRLSGRSRGFGFVDMGDRSEAEAAIEGLIGVDLKGRALVVNEARAR